MTVKPRTLILFAVLEAQIVLAVAYFEPTRCVRGHLWGEEFFEGRPTSWWRSELEPYRVYDLPWIDMRWRNSRFLYRENATRLDRLKKLQWPFGNVQDSWVVSDGPSLPQGSDDAVPVLRELLLDPSPRIRALAEAGLGDHPCVTAEYLKSLEGLLDDPSPTVREFARIGVERYTRRQQQME